MKRIAIIGAGSWGTALAIMATRAGHLVQLWSRNPQKSVQIPSSVTLTSELNAVMDQAELVLFAAPSHTARELFTALTSHLEEGAIIVSASKGIEVDTGKRISEIVKEIAGATYPFVCLSGPSFAKEVVAGHPTAIVVASKDAAAARVVQHELSFENLRIYTNADVICAEIGGSVKNVMAIAAGMAAGLGFGSNSVAALITRGLAEITRLARREGAHVETLMGLAGLRRRAVGSR